MKNCRVCALFLLLPVVGGACGCGRAPHAGASFAALAPAPELRGAEAPEAKSEPDLPEPGTQITVDMTVRSRHGKAVGELQPAELAVRDNGDLVRLSSLRRMEAADRDDNLITILTEPLREGDRRAAHQAAEQLLRAVPNRGYRLAVLTLQSRLRILSGFSTDPATINRAVAQALAPQGAPGTLSDAERDTLATAHTNALSTSPAERAEAKALLATVSATERIVEARRSYPSLAALQALAESEAKLPGRKFILYISSGLPTGSDATEALRSVVSLASRAGVVISVLDTSSPTTDMLNSYLTARVAPLLATGLNGDSLTSAGDPTGTSNVPVSLREYEAHNIGEFELGFGDDHTPSALGILTHGTGGVYLNAHSLDPHGVAELHSNMTSWYQATWSYPGQVLNGQFRPVEVQPASRKDLIVRTRTGYFAMEPDTDGATQPFEVPLLQLLAQDNPPSDLPFHSGILQLGNTPDGNEAELVVQVPLAALESHDDTTTHLMHAHASIVAVVRDKEGSLLARFSEDFPVHQVAEAHHGQQVLTFQRPFSAEPGTYQLQVAVRDALNGKTGVSRSSFTLQPPPASGPSLSQLTLVNNVEPLETANEAGTTFDPMRFGDGLVVPNLSEGAVLPESTKTLSLFLLLHPAAGSSTQPRLTGQILRNGKLVREVPLELQPVSGTGAAIPYLATLGGTHPLPPGDYQVQATLSQDGAAASDRVSFRIAGPASSPEPEPEPGVADPSSEAASAPDEQITLSRSSHTRPPLTATAQAQLLEGVRARALSWSDSLQNFTCQEVTHHFEGTKGTDTWHDKGTLVERLTYIDHKMERTLVSHNGQAASAAEPDTLNNITSTGEFSAMFLLIFKPESHTNFVWKRTAFVEGRPVEVFSYEVSRPNSRFTLSDRHGHSLAAGFHGLLYIDPTTETVRRLSMMADDLPPQLLIRACDFSVDFDWITMQKHDFLLPVRGSMNLVEKHHRRIMNDFEFHDYHRFGAAVRLLAAGTTTP